jgi:hypothetical protein
MTTNERSMQSGINRKLEEIFRFPLSYNTQQSQQNRDNKLHMKYESTMDIVEPARLATVLRNCYEVADNNKEIQKKVFVTMTKCLIICIELYTDFQMRSLKWRGGRNKNNFHQKNKSLAKEDEYNNVKNIMTNVINICEREVRRVFDNGDAETRQNIVDVSLFLMF